VTSLRTTFRLWWQPLRRLRDRESHRQVTFLELFYDLVYVVLIAELAHALSGHVDLVGLVGYAFLFVVVWWAWLNGTLYHDLHGNNDIRTRVFTFL
jgi:low temperature requirement protein LtrA